MKRSLTKRKTVKSASDKSLKPMGANDSGSHAREILRSLDRLHTTFVTRSDALSKAIAELAAVIPTLSREGSYTHKANSLSASESSEATPSGYPEIKRQIKELVNDVLPPDAVVVVVNKGDEELLELEGRIAGHFPQTGEGRYSGYHPESSNAAILQLEEVRLRGAEYLLFPSTAFWWIDHYVEFKQHLDEHYRLATNPTNVCIIYDLSATPSKPSTPRGRADGRISKYLKKPCDQIEQYQSKKAVDGARPAHPVSPRRVTRVKSRGNE